MWPATKFGFYSIIQEQPPDHVDAAVYHVCARVREDSENRFRVTGLQREILARADADYRCLIIAAPQEIFEIMGDLTESIDCDNFKGVIAATPGHRHKLDAYHSVWGTLAAVCNSPVS